MRTRERTFRLPMNASVCVLLLAAACGNSSEPTKQTPAPTPAAPAAAAKPATPAIPAPPAKLATCTDGGALTNAKLTPTGARFCIDAGKRGTTCWAFDGAITPLDPAAAQTAAAGTVEITREHESPESAWKATVDEDKVTICHDSDCKPFAVPVKADDDRQAITDVQVSASGARVAVLRGLEGVAKMSVEIYDRETAKRLGTVRPKMMCAHLAGFAGDVAVMNEWDCANQGGPMTLIAPTGKQLATLDGWWAFTEYHLAIGDTRWAFVQPGDRVDIRDVATGKRVGAIDLGDGDVGFVGDRAYVIQSSSGTVRAIKLDGVQLATARVPPCRYEWETETIGGLAANMTADAAIKLVGAPKTKTKPDAQAMYATTWTYANGLVLDIEASNTDPNTGAAMLPYRVAGITITAPSTLKTSKGIGVGSTQADVEAAYGAHRVAALSSATKLVAGNDDEHEGLEFEFVDGKVSRIHL